MALASCALVLGTGRAGFPPPPATPKRPVTDVYHGVSVKDDYRWLENGADPEVKAWSDAQNQRTHTYLDSLPSREAIHDYLGQLMQGTSGRYFDVKYCGGRFFARKVQPPRPQPLLVTMKSPDDLSSEKIVVDPNRGNDKGALMIDYYVPSPDGKRVAVSISEGGTENGTAHVFEVETGKELSDRVPRANGATAQGSIAWKADGSGFYYTRYPQGHERPKEDLNFYQQVYFHKLGSDSAHDTYVIGKQFPRIAEITLDASEDGQYLLASVANGDGGQFEHFVMNPAGHWTQVTRLEDGIVKAHFGPDGALYLLSRKNAPRGRILRVPLTSQKLTEAKVVVPQTPGGAGGADERLRASIDDMLPTQNRLYVLDVMGGPSRVRVFDHRGKQLSELPVPPISSIGPLLHITGDDILFMTATWIAPPAWYRFDAKANKAQRTAIFVTSPARFDDAEVVREFATSKDGTRVPMNIIRKRGAQLDGARPMLLEGYGGYNISESPNFVGGIGRIWLDQGGVLVIANLRGGGEYGEEWHEAGKLTRKQNVFDDFIACAEHLIEAQYTTPAHLAILGGSNGGLLMGAVLTQHPELFRAAVSFVGVYDSLRAELDPNGTFNIPEFGSVKDPGQFKALYAYSPYHHVRDGVAYPAVLFPTGANDGRVNPYQSRKMTARLQAASSSGRPILLRTSASTGHGAGYQREALEEITDMFAFLFDQLGIEYKGVTGNMM